MHVVLAEEEGAEHAARLLLGEGMRGAPPLHHVLEHALPGVQVVQAVLGEVAHLDVGPLLADAALDGDLAGEDLEQGGLARAVGADEHRALAALELEVQALVDHVLAVGLADPGEAHDAQAGAGRLREAEGDALEVLLGLVGRGGLEPGDLLLLGLGARGHGGLGAEAVDEGLEVGDLALAVAIGGLLLLLARHALEEEGVVVAGVAVEPAAAQLEHAVAERVEEGAVVGDDDEPAGVAAEVVLEPEQGLEVEVVRRLVEQEERGLAHEEASDVGAHDPAAGERPGGQVVVALAEAEAGEDLLGAGLERPVHLGVGVVRVVRRAGRRDLEDGLLADGGALLGQEAEVRAALPLGRALVGLLLAEDDAEEGRLPRAVGPDQPQAVAPLEGEGDVGEELLRAVGLGDVGEGEQGRSGRSGPRAGGAQARSPLRPRRRSPRATRSSTPPGS